MSLSVPHPIWLTCGSNSYEISKAIIQAKMLSGRYRTDQFVRHFTDNDGSCVTCESNAPGDIVHLLLLCPAFKDTRTRMLQNLESNCEISDIAKTLIKNSFQTTTTSIQLLLDPSVLPNTIRLKQSKEPLILQHLFKFSRSWCYSIHKTRLKLLGRWQNWQTPCCINFLYIVVTHCSNSHVPFLILIFHYLDVMRKNI